MAKGNKNLAGIAAIGALGYMLSRKKSKDDAGDQKTSAYMPADTRTKDAGLESPEETIKRSTAKAPGDSNPITEADVVMPEKLETKAVTAPKMRNKVAEKAVDKRFLSPDEAASNYKPRYTPTAMAPKTTQGKTYPQKPYMPEEVDMSMGRKKGGMIKKMASGGMTASRRGDGIASKGKTRGRMC
jgi:hypothetical protein